MNGMMHSYRHVLLAAAAGVAALAGTVLLPASASAQAAGTPVTPTITLVLSPTTVDYGHQSVTASGTVTTSGGPVEGATVTVSYIDTEGQSAQISLPTGTNGGYTATIPDPDPAAQSVTAAVAATASTGTASASASLGFTTDAVSISASFAQPDVNAGSTDTLSGVASYISGGAPHPLANSTLSITAPGDFPPISPVNTTVTTAADGSFSYTLVPVPDGAGMDFTVSSAATPYLEAGQLTVALLINQGAGVDDFTGTLGADRVLRFVACAGIGDPLVNAPLDGPLEYQYARASQGPWKTLGTGKPNDNGPCYLGHNSGGDGTYTGKYTAPLANGYYRAYAPAVPGQMSAVSHVIHLWKYPTKITGFTITPCSVGRAGKVTISGRLWAALTKKRTPDARQRIVIEFRYHNKTYVLRHRLMTDSAGRFRGTFAVPHTAAWLALYKGGKTQFATASKAVTIKVR
jgi:hypothetical protein